MPAAAHNDLLRPDAPSVTVLVPSLREEPRVLRMTVLSAAFARYGNRRIAVLLDDPPHTESAQLSRDTVDDVTALLGDPMARMQAARDAWQARRGAATLDATAEAVQLGHLNAELADWLADFARRLEAEVSVEFRHVDRFFIDEVVRALAHHYRSEGERLATAALSEAAIAAAYERLAGAFCTDISYFERKLYDNLSHAPNKAMNLNSYIGLMGGRYDIVDAGAGLHITAAAAVADVAGLDVPASRYVLTLDADSVILPGYILELAHIIEHDDSIGVVQTPYLTFPGSTAPVERVAGATTDIQFLVHQGSSHFNAAYWVGANALIRLAALDVIHTVQTEGHKSVDVYIQDATVIEDTGSTIDLLAAGWRVHNHYAGLAYSATPADFGSLSIQRQRWSNGGLIILPILLRHYFATPGRRRRFAELMLRSHYLLSPLVGNTAVFLLMLCATVDARHMVLTPLAMLPYFLLYGWDLSRSGYRFRDLFAVCALNLMLLPVGFAGIFASIRQMVTGRKGAFVRTPKVAGRTGVPPVFVLFNLAMLLLMAHYVVDGVRAGDYLASTVPAVNLALYGYGMARLIGLRSGALDLALGARRLLAPLARVVPHRLLGHRATRLAAGGVALVMGLLPVSFESADAGPPRDIARPVAAAEHSKSALQLRPGLAFDQNNPAWRGAMTTQDD